MTRSCQKHVPLLGLFSMLCIFSVQAQNFILNKDFIFTTDFSGGGILLDFNQDGYKDMLYADKRDIYLFVNKATGKIQFDKIRLASETSPAKVFQPFDIDGDNDLDVLVGAAGRVFILENKSTLTKVELVRNPKDLFYFGSFSTKVPAYFVNDLNQDGLLDVLVAYGDTKIGFQKTDKSYFTYDVPDADLDQVQKVLPADLDKDGKPDFLLARNSASGGGLIYFLNSNNSFNSRGTAWSGPVRDFVLLDINQDSLPDVITLDYSGKNGVVVLKNTGNPANLFQADTLQVGLGGQYSSFVFTDVDQVPGEEFVVGYEQAAGLTILSGESNIQGNWTAKPIPLSYGICDKVLVGDLDMDEDMDVVQLLDDNGFLVYQNATISHSSEQNNPGLVTIYPNPSTANVRVVSQFDIQKTLLFNQHGILVKKQEGLYATEGLIDVSGQSPGNYSLEVHLSNGTVQYSRIVIIE